MSTAEKKISPDFVIARRHMIESQIRPNNVRNERVLCAMETVPREIFVPSLLSGIAYIDEDIQVAKGRYLLEPRVFARLLEAAELKEQDRVLDVAPATGYSTACLSLIAKEVVALENDPILEKIISINLVSLSCANVSVVHGELSKGWSKAGPYDAIIINGCVDSIPEALFAQLAEGGRLLAVLRQFGPAHAAHIGEARLYKKIKGNVSHRSLFNANPKSLVEFETAKIFTF